MDKIMDLPKIKLPLGDAISGDQWHSLTNYVWKRLKTVIDYLVYLPAKKARCLEIQPTHLLAKCLKRDGKGFSSGRRLPHTSVTQNGLLLPLLDHLCECNQDPRSRWSKTLNIVGP